METKAPEAIYTKVLTLPTRSPPLQYLKARVILWLMGFAMKLSNWSLLLGGLLSACLASFGWSMAKFLSRPAGSTIGWGVIGVCVGFSILHLTAILLTPVVRADRGLAAALLYLCALGLFWWAVQVNWRRPLALIFAPDSPLHLVERGPYRLMRHPFYCSYTLM
jgi:hypothetical protein